MFFRISFGIRFLQYLIKTKVGFVKIPAHPSESLSNQCAVSLRTSVDTLFFPIPSRLPFALTYPTTCSHSRCFPHACCSDGRSRLPVYFFVPHSAQAIRAIRLASATTISICSLCAGIRVSHEPSVEPGRIQGVADMMWWTFRGRAKQESRRAQAAIFTGAGSVMTVERSFSKTCGLRRAISNSIPRLRWLLQWSSHSIRFLDSSCQGCSPALVNS